MRNRTKELLDAGKTALGAQLRFGSPAIAELFGHADFDWLIIDAEHSPQTAPGIQAQIQAIGNTQATPAIRLPKVDVEQIRLYLDMGAMIVACAFVNTAADAQLGARACRYPPQGIRGWGPHRAAQYGMQAKQYTDTINDQVMFVSLIETQEAVDNIDSILAVDGMDALLIGAVDLAISLGVPFDFQNPVFQEAEGKVLAAARRAGKPAGLGLYESPLDPASLQRAIAAGHRNILIGGDEFLLTSGCQQFNEIFTKIRS